MISKHNNSGPLNVLMIRNTQPYDFGGGERIPIQLAREFKTHGLATTVVSRAPKLLEYAAANDIPTIRGLWWSKQNWSALSNLLLPVYAVWQLILFFWYISLIRKTRTDVVHPQSKDDFIAATLAGKALGKRVLWSDYADLKYIYQNHTIWYKNPLGKFTFYISRYAHAIILTSHSDETFIKESLGMQQLPPQYVVVYNGVSEQTVAPAKRDSVDSGAYVYCATSRMVTAKGIGELIRAFRSLHDSHNDVRLWLAGDGPEIEDFRKLADNHPAIHFYGHVSAPLPLVAACDVFVHPSYLEGFSISLIEAAMLAKPIIACNVGGNPEIIIDHKTGLLVKDRDDKDLLKAMEILYNDRELAADLAANARSHYVADLRFEDLIANQFVPLYGKS